MQKTLVLFAAVLSLAAAALGFVNRNRMIEAKVQASQAREQLDTVSKNGAKTAADLRTANEKLSIVNSDSEKNAAELAQLREDNSKAVAAQADLKKQIADKEALLSKQKDELSDKEQQIKDLQSKTSSASQQTSSPSDDLKKQLEEKDLLNAGLQAKLKELESQVSSLKEREAQSKSKTMRAGLTGRVLAVNSAWNFVVLSLGDRNGVVNGAEMLVYRGNRLIGKVRITSVEPSTSIADIVANSVRGGLSVQPGDNVIYPSPGADNEFQTAQ